MLGAFVGVAAAHLMFGEALLQMSHHARAGGGQLFSEFVATFGLLCAIWGCARLRSETVPMAVGLYITGAYWFTASTSFSNPAVTLARAFTDTFAGIRPLDAAGFVVPQFLGAFTAMQRLGHWDGIQILKNDHVLHFLCSTLNSKKDMKTGMATRSTDPL